MTSNEPEQGKVRVRCFGELQIVRPDGTHIHPMFMLPRRAALFLYLALADPPRAVSRSELVSMFWPFQAPGAAEHALEKSLFSLRQYVGEVWDSADNEITIVRDSLWCDVWAFREAIAGDDLDRATGLYQGPFLERPELFGAGEFQMWVEEERERLRQAAIGCFARLAYRHAQRGNWEIAAQTLRQAARAEPLDETSLRCLMVALVRAGDRDAALRTYELLKRRLALRHGREPERETETLAEVIGKGATPPLEPFLPT